MNWLGRLRPRRTWESLAVCLCLLLLAASYGHYYAFDPRRPGSLTPTTGWWTFGDQGRYLTDTLAWVAGDLDPARHWYMPGYALLAAPFARLATANPFLLPDAGLLLASLWLTAALAAELLPALRGARAIGAAAFLATALQPATMEVWVTPWTSTPAAPLILGCVLALLRFLRQPTSWRLALAASLCAAGLVAFRPGDAAVMLPLTALAGAARLVTARPGWRAGLAVAAAAAAGVVGPVLLVTALHVAVHGWRLSAYLEFSATLGFDWRLLPLQWVTLVLSPQPLLPSGEGLLPTYPFIATGLAGMAACLVKPPAGGLRAAHLVVVAAAIGYGVLYLCYRDLHPPGLWRFFNYHYFKWLLPVFALYTVALILALPRPAPALAAACILVAILPWRAELRPLGPVAAFPGHALALPDGLGVDRGLVVAARGAFDSIFEGVNHFYFGPQGRQYFGATGAIAAYPIPGGLLLAPLLRLPPGPGWAVLDPRISLEPEFPPRLAKLALVYGRPCYLPDWLGGRARCRFVDPIPAPIWPAATPITFGAAIQGFLTTGWGPADQNGLWTEGGHAGLRGRVRPALSGGTLSLVVTGYIPEGSEPLRVTLRAGGIPCARWVLDTATPQILQAELPPRSFGPDGLLELELAIDNPRRPSDYANSADSRLLGLLVRSATIEPRAQ